MSAYIRLVLGDATTLGEGDKLVDLIAVERVVNGRGPAALTRYEQVYAARVMRKHGMSVADILARLHVSDSTVRRWEAKGWDLDAPEPVKVVRPREVQPCGTPAAYRRHLAAGEPTCPACRAANAESDRRYRLTGSRTAVAA